MAVLDYIIFDCTAFKRFFVLEPALQRGNVVPRDLLPSLTWTRATLVDDGLNCLNKSYQSFKNLARQDRLRWFCQ